MYLHADHPGSPVVHWLRWSKFGFLARPKPADLPERSTPASPPPCLKSPPLPVSCSVVHVAPAGSVAAAVSRSGAASSFSRRSPRWRQSSDSPRISDSPAKPPCIPQRPALSNLRTLRGAARPPLAVEATISPQREADNCDKTCRPVPRTRWQLVPAPVFCDEAAKSR